MTLQNEPQLTAEMEKRFSKIMLEWIESQWKIEQAHQNGEPYTRMKFEADANKVEKKLKHFLATALEEQRQKVLSEVEGWLVDVKEPKSGISDYVDDFARHSVNEYCAELRTKLNQLKGSDVK